MDMVLILIIKYMSSISYLSLPFRISFRAGIRLERDIRSHSAVCWRTGFWSTSRRTRTCKGL